MNAYSTIAQGPIAGRGGPPGTRESGRYAAAERGWTATRRLGRGTDRGKKEVRSEC